MNSEFPATRMSVLEQIREGKDDERKAALDLFIQNYRKPLVQFLVKCKKVPESDAEDAVQDFMVKKVLTGKILNHDQGRGRFRNLLRVALQRDFLTQVEKTNRERIDDHLDPQEMDQPGEEEGIDDQIDQAWAIAVFSSALVRLRAECIYWDLFHDRVIVQPPLPYDEIIAKHQFKSPEKASNFLMTAKRAFNRILGECILEQSSWTNESSDAALESEIEFLRQRLQAPGVLHEALASIEANDAHAVSLSLSLAPDDAAKYHFINETSDENWDTTDLKPLMNHLLGQPLGTFVKTENDLTLGEFLLSPSSTATDLELIKNLKEFFNVRAKSGKSRLPTKMDVAMTFVTMARFVLSDGRLNEITSMRQADLAERLQSLLRMDWIPEPIAGLIEKAQMRMQ